MECQMLADRQIELDSVEQDNLSDYEMPHETVDDLLAEINGIEEESKQEDEESKIDLDLEEEYRLNENRESV
eukprot:CAMPEP_0176357956 /NCGR_PEP_ID=MMETSP0126-20121128/15178_1 /TAXON_ID=141414 ORGANISM="Strombidinopsis acuminatum, Strain SPMC142" /NCGR_SAMPLE_ID=MMETSP0126 /ASSEMBLY_ACC=CAM_ASM_000229 /LENGTH=71 /DNA_ID=CAMNT_0017711855 /DNA_START=243 /DNA_END=458 /DNA_ORIENTATION=-